MFKRRESRSRKKLTILCCSNADSSHKMPLFVILKSKSPRYFRGIKFVPVQYEANFNAWITSASFQKWSGIFDNKMMKIKVKPIFVIDVCYIFCYIYMICPTDEMNVR